MIPAIVNTRSGTAAEARDALQVVGAFAIEDVEPTNLVTALDAVLRDAPSRLVVAGGDGTLATAAAALVHSPTALGVLPGGTLNHFARDFGIPADMHDAARIAASGPSTTADVAYAGTRLFLNTSAVGVYTSYVRWRERFERIMGYRLATLAAAIRLLFTMRSLSVQMTVNGTVQTYQTPLVFIGVGERELKAPQFGRRRAGGRRCLHVMVVRERRAARLLASSIAAAARGLSSMTHAAEVDSYFVDRCTITTPYAHQRLALDGEIVAMSGPIEYHLERDALTIVVPPHAS